MLDAEKLARELDWNLLRTFVVLAEASSVTEAAQRLRLKQPTVSAALKRLETRVGRTLLERGPGRYRLTAAGRALHAEAVEIRGRISGIATALRDVDDVVRGHVRVALASHVHCPLFDRALRAFHAECPEATIALDVMRSKDALDEIVARRASVAICLVRERSAKLEYRRLYREFFGLYCGGGHPLFGRTRLELADLAGMRAVGFVTDRFDDALDKVARLRAAAGLDPRLIGASAHLEEVRRMIVAGLGVGALPIHVARADVEAGRLRRLPPEDDPPAIDVHVAWRPGARSNRAERAFLERLLAAIEATPIERRTYR